MIRMTDNGKTSSTQCHTLLPFPVKVVLGGTGMLIAHLQFDCCGGASGKCASCPVHLLHRFLHGQHCQIPALKSALFSYKPLKVQTSAAGFPEMIGIHP